MNIKKINNFLGYSLYIVGASKIILIILAFLKFGKAFSDIVNQNAITSSEIITLVSGIIGIIQIILAIASVLMIFVNLSNEPKNVKGYLYALGAILIEIFVPSFFLIFFIFVECSLYMKAGSILVNSSTGNSKTNKKNEELAKNTEWFFDEKREETRVTDKKEENISNIEEKSEEGKGISISTILIAWIAIIVLILVVYFIFDMINNKDKEDVNAVFVQNSIINTIKNTNITTSESKNRIEKKESNTTLTITKPEETDDRLTKIANIFNSGEIATAINVQGYIVTAISSENEIRVYGSGEGINTTIVYTLNGDILSTEVIEDKTDSSISLIRLLHAMVLMDSVGVYKGYPERAIMNAFEKDEAQYYTVEKEGIELKEDSETGNIIIKIDLSKDFSFLNNN